PGGCLGIRDGAIAHDADAAVGVVHTNPPVTAHKTFTAPGSSVIGVQVNHASSPCWVLGPTRRAVSLGRVRKVPTVSPVRTRSALSSGKVGRERRHDRREAAGGSAPGLTPDPPASGATAPGGTGGQRPA